MRETQEGLRPSTFVYEQGLPVAYVCRHGYIHTECTAHNTLCPEVGEDMLRWNRSMSGQARVRIGKRDMMLDPDREEAPIYRRLLNE